MTLLGEALGLRRPAHRAEALELTLCERQVLLVLDNFEHLLAAAPPLVETLGTLAGVKVLVTSRAALRVRGERELPIPPLPVIDPDTAARDLPLRQQTLRAALAWSYDLLPPEQQRLFRQLAVFESGCTLAAATAVCGEAEPEAQVLEGLAALVDNSLLRVETRPAAEQRFRILETIREFALERLTSDADDPQATRRRHALYFLSLAEAASDDGHRRAREQRARRRV